MSLIPLLIAIFFAVQPVPSGCTLNPQRESACQPALIPIGTTVNVVLASGAAAQGVVEAYYYEPTANPGFIRRPGEVLPGDTLVYSVRISPAQLVTVPVESFPAARP